MNEADQPNHEQETLVDDITKKIRLNFPIFTTTNRDEFLQYDPDNDPKDTGHVLWFYPEVGKTNDGPSMCVIYRPKGFVVNYYNCPPSDDQPRIHNAGNSMYGPSVNGYERRYFPGEEDFALEKAKIHMQGIVIGDPKPYQQIVGWVDAEDKFITLEEKIKAYQTKKLKLNFKDSVTESLLSPANNIWGILEKSPDRAKEIALARIKTEPTYTNFAGETMPLEQITEEINSGSKAGSTALDREYHLIGAYETLLRDHQIL